MKDFTGNAKVFWDMFIVHSKHMTAETMTSRDVDTEKGVGSTGKIYINIPTQ